MQPNSHQDDCKQYMFWIIVLIYYSSSETYITLTAFNMLEREIADEYIFKKVASSFYISDMPVLFGIQKFTRKKNKKRTTKMTII